MARRAWFSVLLLSLGSVLVGEVISNWPVPATWTPPRSGGLTTLGETNPLPFIAVTPCRVVDTRNSNGPYGGPALATNVARTFDIDSGACGIPSGLAAAYSLSFGAILPPADGFLSAWPTGVAQPTISQVNLIAGEVVANAAIVPAGTNGAINVLVNIGPTHVYIDINGYFPGSTASNRLATGEFLGIYGTRAADAVIVGENDSPTAGSSGIRGVASGAGVTYGVSGSSGILLDAAGVRGAVGPPLAVPPTGFFEPAGVRGEGGTAATGFGVLGLSPRFGVSGYLFSPGPEFPTEGHLGYGFEGKYGVAGFTYIVTNQTAGVFGNDSTGTPAGTGVASAGVRGESNTGVGVYGRSQANGVLGYLVDDAGSTLASGGLGMAGGTAGDMTTGPWGVFASGKLGATLTKHFVEPHPSDPTQVIVYSSLEGREVGTYFRGTARTVNRHAVIEVPEDFRIVTEEEGLTVQLTAVGAPPTMYVASKDLRRIVVRSAADVEFDYLVQGVRRGFRDLQPVQRGQEFVPRSLDDRVPAYVTEDAKRRLIANGTYNADGTVNVETAERLGWTRMWREKEQRDREAAQAARARAAIARRP
jgi:hypothetical protein